MNSALAHRLLTELTGRVLPQRATVLLPVRALATSDKEGSKEQHPQGQASTSPPSPAVDEQGKEISVSEQDALHHRGQDSQQLHDQKQQPQQEEGTSAWTEVVHEESGKC